MAAGTATYIATERASTLHTLYHTVLSIEVVFRVEHWLRRRADHVRAGQGSVDTV